MTYFRKIVENILNEIDSTQAFNIEEFSKLHSFQKRVQYCNERLQRLGAGSSRIAYKLNEERVLKIAKNSKGIAQNEKEADFGRNNYGITTYVYDVDSDNYTWIEMELAYPIKKSEVKSLIGVDFSQLIGIICYMHDEYARPGEKIFERYNQDPSSIKKIMEDEVYTENNEFLYRLYTFLSDFQPKIVSDYCHIKNWGKVLRNNTWEMVIVDDGFDENVAKLYYR